jgi:hypothetical protein
MSCQNKNLFRVIINAIPETLKAAELICAIVEETLGLHPGWVDLLGELN